MNKLFLFILSILLIIPSCKSKKAIKSTRDVVLESAEHYNSKDTSVFILEEEPRLESIQGEGVGMGSPGSIGHGSYELVVNPKSTKNIRYVDNTSSNESSSGSQVSTSGVPSSIGKVAFSVQDTMKVGNTYIVKLRITREGNNTFLSGIVSDTTKETSVYIEKIRISSVMSAKLSDPEGKFDIKMIGDNASQSIEKEGFTEWTWMVKPIKSGMNKLVVILTIRIEDVDGYHPKDIEVLNKTILTRVNAIYTITDFMESNWQWFVGFISPIVVWLWNRRRKRRRNT